MKIKKSMSKQFYIFSLCICIIVFTLFIIGNFISNVRENEIKISDKNLYTIANSNASTVRFLFDSYLNDLKTTAVLVEKYPDLLSDEALLLLDEISTLHKYERLSISFFDGKTYSSDGKYFEVPDLSYVENIKNDKPFISNVTRSYVDNSSMISLFVPLHNSEGEPVASLLLGVRTMAVTEALNLTFYNGEGYYHLIDDHGNYVSDGISTNSLLMNQNYFDIIDEFEYNAGFSAKQIKDLFKTGNSGYSKYSVGDEKLYSYFEPVGINNWVLMTIVPKEIVSNQEKENIWLSVALAGQLLLLLFSVFVYIYYIQTKSSKVAVLNEQCFRALAEQTSKVIFEWDFSEAKIKTMSNFKNLFGRDIITQTGSIEAIDANVIHPDDISIFSSIFEQILSGNTIGGIRFRIKDSSNAYRWCSISGTVVNDSKGKPYKAIGSLEDISELVQKEEYLKQKSEKDSLTGLYNKITTELLIKQSLNGIDCSLTNSALMIIDIDNFKSINDKLGHQYGDQVLIQLSTGLTPIFRANDIVGRIGGDEFFVFLKNYASTALLTEKAQQICKVFRNQYIEGNIVCNISASIGISIFPDHGTDFGVLYKNADVALYLTKEKGKDGFSIYDGTVGAGYVSARTEIESHS